MRNLVCLFTMIFIITSICIAAPGDKIYFEDFSSYKEGELPAGWIGGDNLAVKVTKRKNILAPFVKGSYDVTTKNIKFPENFKVTILTKYYDSTSTYTIYIGSYKIIQRYNEVRTEVKKKETRSQKVDISKGKTYSLSLKKEGIIYSLYINSQKVLTGRYSELEFSNIRFNSGAIIEIESITIEEI